MKIQIPQPNIPILEKPLIVVNIDLKRKREHIVIGEFDDVNRYLRGWKKRTIIFLSLIITGLAFSTYRLYFLHRFHPSNMHKYPPIASYMLPDLNF